jgi:hypothetical protein
MEYHTLGNLITAFLNKPMGNSSHNRNADDAEAQYVNNTLSIKTNGNSYMA